MDEEEVSLIMRILLTIIYTGIFMFMLYQVLRVWRQLPSRAWNHIGGGLFGIFVARWTGLFVLFYPEIRQTQYGILIIQVIYHSISILALSAVAYGFYVLANNLRHFLKRKVTEPLQ